MNRTQAKQLKKMQAIQAAQAEAVNSFVAQLARDLYVARCASGNTVWAGSMLGTAHECMEAAIAYYQALATFRKPAPAPELQPVDANGSPVEEGPIQENGRFEGLTVEEEARLDREGEGRELARDATEDA